MTSYAGIARNFRFMLVQVRKQLENTGRLLTDPHPRWAKAIRASEGYVDTQKSMIENECFSFIRKTPDQDKQTLAAVRAVSVITANLERIADFTVNTTRQLEHLSNFETLRPFDCPAYIHGLMDGINLIERALFGRDAALALRICRVEDHLDQLYHADLKRVIADLRETRDVEDLVTTLFILHYLERMGDALLNIGEAIIFAVLGERLKVHQYRVLDEALAGTQKINEPLKNVELDSIWGTRSGVRIGKMEGRSDTGRAHRVLFKEGNPDKLTRERQSLERWEHLAPGLVPQVVEYESGDQGDALLLQYLDGQTLQDVALNAEPPLMNHVIRRLTATVDRIWTATRTDRPANGAYLEQLQSRIDDVYRLHPEFRTRAVQVGTKRVPSFEERLVEAAELDTQLQAPFSVFIHGDFNLDNIIYNVERDTLHFVDVQRSRDMDYVQDVSVLLVSAFRLPVFVARTRRALETLALGFLQFARDFARRNDDTTFEARLALGLVRSFSTSTRFELNRRFARNMHQRALLLLNRLVEHRRDDYASFRVPDSVLVY